MTEVGLRPDAVDQPVGGEGRRAVPFAMTTPDGVPAERYYDPAFADLERRYLWPRAW